MAFTRQDNDYLPINLNSVSVIRFINDLTLALSFDGSVNNILPGILEMTGRYLNAQIIKIHFANGNVKQELEWTDTRGNNGVKQFSKIIPLKKTGPDSQIIFTLDTPNVFSESVSYTHLRAHETRHDLVCRL